MVSRNDKVTSLWKKFLMKCLYNIDKSRILIVHREFFDELLTLSASTHEHIFGEKLTIA